MTQGFLAINSLVLIACFIFVVIKMFQHGDSTMGIVSIVTLLCGIGTLIALVYGWMNVGKYNAMIVMVIYTIAFLALGPASFLSGAFN